MSEKSSCLPFGQPELCGRIEGFNLKIAHRTLFDEAQRDLNFRLLRHPQKKLSPYTTQVG